MILNKEALHLSKFTLGTVQLGLNYGMANRTGQPSRENAFEILDTARRLGVTSLDTAAAYGTSEQVVGDWLRARKPQMFVTSKFKIRGTEALDELNAQLAQSKERLGRVDGYMFHDAQQMRAYSDLLRDRLERAREEDGLTFVGASVYTAEDVEAFLELGWLQAIQVPMNMLDNRIVERGLLQELQKRGVLVFVRSVFLQGMLCMDKAPEKFSFMQPSLDALAEIARAEDMSMTQMAVSFIRDLPGVDSLALGCETPAQVESNAQLIEGKSISASGLAAIAELAKKVPIEHCMDVILGKA